MKPIYCSFDVAENVPFLDRVNFQRSVQEIVAGLEAADISVISAVMTPRLGGWKCEPNVACSHFVIVHRFPVPRPTLFNLMHTPIHPGRNLDLPVPVTILKFPGRNYDHIDVRTRESNLPQMIEMSSGDVDMIVRAVRGIVCDGVASVA